MDAAPKQLLIGGEWRDATGGATLAVEDPSTGEPICEIADATPEDAQAAIDAAAGRRPTGRPLPLTSAARSCGRRSSCWANAPTSSRC